jgi:NAD(P)H-dependent flavin oxidoreductase YrpB (nitropropane dioxygenase family)
VTAVSLELGRSSAARDDDDRESERLNDTAGADDFEEPRPDATEGGRPHRSVLAPFMAAADADDSPPDDARPDADEAAATVDAGDTTGAAVPAPAPASAPASASTVPAPRTSATGPRSSTTGPRIAPGGPGADLDGPLLEDAEELRANWLRLQAGFVDDPHEAVSDAADLVEHTAQALVGALRMRQQRLREMWDGGRPKGSGTAGADEDGQSAGQAAADTTEQLRLLMQRYRLLFNHICRS